MSSPAFLGAVETVHPAEAAPVQGEFAAVRQGFYFTDDDGIRVSVANAVAGAAVEIHYRMRTAEGPSFANAHRFVPTSDRLVTSQDFALGAGELLNLVAFASAGSPKIGQTFVIVDAIRGRGNAAIVLGTLLQDYVTARQRVAWPGSPLRNSLDGPGVVRTITGTQPAAGVNISETVPTGARWQAIALSVDLLTSATVGTRTPTLIIGPTGHPTMFAPNARTLPASTSRSLSWAAGMTLENTYASNLQSSALPTDAPLLAGDRLYTVTSGLDVADQYGPPDYYVREWLEVQ